MSTLALTSNTLVGTAASGQIEYNGQFFATDSTDSRGQLERITQRVAVPATSTIVEFTDIPAWAKKITIMFDGFSNTANGTSIPIIQLGDSGGYELTGYVSTSVDCQGAALSVGNQTTGLGIASQQLNAYLYCGLYTLSLLNSATNTWVGGGNFVQSTIRCSFSSGSKSLSDTLNRLRITTVNGTDTFDGGTINIMYEG